MTQAKFSLADYPLTTRKVGGTLWPALKLKQIYRCPAHHCRKRRLLVESWLTVADCAQLLTGGGLRCSVCGTRLKWVRAEPERLDPKVDPRG